jgi:hypothetical protein
LVNADEWPSAMPEKESDLLVGLCRVRVETEHDRTSASRHQLSRVVSCASE